MRVDATFSPLCKKVSLLTDLLVKRASQLLALVLYKADLLLLW